MSVFRYSVGIIVFCFLFWSCKNKEANIEVLNAQEPSTNVISSIIEPEPVFVQEFVQENENNKTIIGRWVREDYRDWWLFNDNGTVKRSPNFYSTSGKYYIDDKRNWIMIVWNNADDDDGDPYPFELSNNDEILTLSLGGGPVDFRRVREEDIEKINEQDAFITNVVGGPRLSGYNGFWTKYQDNTLKITYMAPYYPDRMDILRNEIYARYGKPFTEEKYKEYFSTQSWYKEVENFSDSWLTRYDIRNIELIKTIEHPSCYYAIDEARNNNVVYMATTIYNIHFPSFTRDIAVIGYNSEFDGSYINITAPWVVMGNWILTYRKDSSGRSYEVTSYLIDPATKMVTGYEHSSRVDSNIFEPFLSSQQSIKNEYTKNW